MLKVYKLITFGFFALCLGSAWSSATAQPTCLKHKDYLLLENSDRKNVGPCDFLGALYLYGIGGPVFIKAGDSVPDEYLFYYFTRTYLAKKNKIKSEKIDEKTQKDLDLLAYMALTTFSDKDVLVSAQRKNTYKSFLLREIFNKNLSADSSILGMVHSYMGIYAAELGFETWKDLNCFVKHDLPTFSYEQILKSETFMACKGK